MCILENYPECSNPKVFYIIPYFCGQHPQCRYESGLFLSSLCCRPAEITVSCRHREPGAWALERAKQNVLENYLLVGILEELEDVLLLLERLLPHYFTGVLDIYKSPGTSHLQPLLPISPVGVSEKQSFIRFQQPTPYFLFFFLQTTGKWGT